MASDRFSRQVLLSEVGELGQKRIQEAKVRLPEGPESAVAADYLQRAGVSDVSITPDAPRSDFPHASHFRHTPSTALGHGAWHALSELRAVLKL